ncbi:hypothetical protein Tco_0714819 [Tanacetum coccineum]
MGHGSGTVQRPDSAQCTVLFQRRRDQDSPVEEVSPVKPKKPSRRVAKAKKKQYDRLGDFEKLNRVVTEQRPEKAVNSSRGELIHLLIVPTIYYETKKKLGKKDKEQQSYIELKNRELSIREVEAREIAKLKREKLEIQRRTLELAEREKQDRDILFYNSAIDMTLPPIQQEKLLEMKIEIKARYNLDY